MSKHLGNILEPMPLMEQHGADAVRWFMAGLRLAVGRPPGRARHHPGDRPQGAADLLEHRRLPRALRAQRRLDARGGEVPPGRGAAGARPVAARGDRAAGRRGRPRRWRASTPSAPGRLLAQFVDDLSNWYVRRSRRRFWDGDAAALATLHDTPRRGHPAAGAADPVHHRAGLAGRRPPGRPGGAGVGAPGRRGRSTTRPRSTRTCPPGSRWRAGSSSSAGPPAPTPRCAPGSRCAARWWRSAAHGPAHRRAARRGRRGAQRRRGRAAVVRGRGPGRLLRQGQLPRARQAVRQADPAGRRGDRRRRRRRAGRRAGGRRQGRAVTRRRRGRRGAPRRGDRLRAPARGLVGRQRAGRDRRARPRADPGAGPGRPGPRGGPAGAGGPQEQRLRRQRPDRADLAGRRGDRRGAARARRAGRRARCWRSRCTRPTRRQPVAGRRHAAGPSYTTRTSA